MYKDTIPKVLKSKLSDRREKTEASPEQNSFSRSILNDQRPIIISFKNPKTFKTETLNGNPKMKEVKTKLLKISTHLLTARKDLSTDRRISSLEHPLLNISSDGTTMQSARLPRASTTNSYLNRHGWNFPSPSSAGWAIKGGYKSSHDNDYVLQNNSMRTARREKTDSSINEVHRVQELISQCDDMNKEFLKIEKKVSDTEAKYERQVHKLELKSPADPYMKNFWKTNESFLHQRAKMNMEVEKFRNQIREKEEETKKKKEEARFLGTPIPKEEKDVDEEINNEANNKINQIILQISRAKKTGKTDKKAKIELRIKKKELSDQIIKTEGDAGGDNTGRWLVKNLGTDNDDYSYFKDISLDSQPKSVNKKKKVLIKKVQKTAGIGLGGSPINNLVALTKRSKTHEENQDFIRNLDAASAYYMLGKTNIVSSADVKRRQKIFLAQFKLQRPKNTQKADSPYSKSATSRRTLSQNL